MRITPLVGQLEELCQRPICKADLLSQLDLTSNKYKSEKLYREGLRGFNKKWSRKKRDLDG